MSDSPYQAPRAESYEPQLPPGADREKVYLVAKHQRRVLQALLAAIVLNVAFMALGRQGPVFQLVCSWSTCLSSSSPSCRFSGWPGICTEPWPPCSAPS